MRWAELLLAVLVGAAAGIGGYTFVYARGASYLTDDPAACANCHVMREQFDGWSRSSHRSVAVCNDCHTPDGLVPKYVTKARNGFWHSFYFTTGGFPEPIRITPRNLEVTEGACRTCHAEVVHAIDAMPRAGGALSCVQCHRDAGHLH
ncbi:MAG TPA: cytochrome c nitrite reductase small subunit [Vicinamibacterales bacterium]